MFTLQLERSNGQLVADTRDADVAITDTDGEKVFIVLTFILHC